MFKIFNCQHEPSLANDVSVMLNSDSNAIFNVFSEPLANTLGLFSHSAVGYEVGALLDDDNNVCGYALFNCNRWLEDVGKVDPEGMNWKNTLVEVA